MHLCADAQKPRSVKTAPAVLTDRTSCINATDSKCRRAIKPKAQNLSTLSANARGDDILNRSRSACDEGTCVNASRELQAQSKPSRFNRDSDFAAPPVLVYRPKGSAGEGKTEEWKGAPPVPSLFVPEKLQSRLISASKSSTIHAIGRNP